MAKSEELPTFRSRSAIIGWRGWNIIHPYFLTNSSVVWIPGERTEAICTARDHDDDVIIPADGCSCGVYAFNAPYEVKSQGYVGQTLLGEVYLWGKVIEHERGYKAQYAYPKCFYAKCRSLFEHDNTAMPRGFRAKTDKQWRTYEDLALQVAAHYQVPLSFIDGDHPIYKVTPEEQRRQAELEQKRRLEIAQERAVCRKKNEQMKMAAMNLPPLIQNRGFKSLWDQIMWEADEEVRRRLERKKAKP